MGITWLAVRTEILATGTLFIYYIVPSYNFIIMFNSNNANVQMVCFND